jgi:hypothetical protein
MCGQRLPRPRLLLQLFTLNTGWHNRARLCAQCSVRLLTVYNETLWGEKR